MIPRDTVSKVLFRLGRFVYLRREMAALDTVRPVGHGVSCNGLIRRGTFRCGIGRLGPMGLGVLMSGRGVFRQVRRDLFRLGDARWGQAG